MKKGGGGEGEGSHLGSQNLFVYVSKKLNYNESL